MIHRDFETAHPFSARVDTTRKTVIAPDVWRNYILLTELDIKNLAANPEILLVGSTVRRMAGEIEIPRRSKGFDHHRQFMLRTNSNPDTDIVRPRDNFLQACPKPVPSRTNPDALAYKEMRKDTVVDNLCFPEPSFDFSDPVTAWCVTQACFLPDTLCAQPNRDGSITLYDPCDVFSIDPHYFSIPFIEPTNPGSAGTFRLIRNGIIICYQLVESRTNDWILYNLRLATSSALFPDLAQATSIMEFLDKTSNIGSSGTDDAYFASIMATTGILGVVANSALMYQEANPGKQGDEYVRMAYYYVWRLLEYSDKSFPEELFFRFYGGHPIDANIGRITQALSCVSDTHPDAISHSSGSLVVHDRGGRQYDNLALMKHLDSKL